MSKIENYKDARVLTSFNPNDPKYKQHIAITIGPNRESKNWRPDDKTPDVATFVAHLAQHPEDKHKDGWGFVGGEMAKGRRLKSAVKALYVVGLDLDRGTSPDVIDAALVKLGALALRYTTHSNGATSHEFKRDEIHKFAPGEEIDTALMRRFLTEKHGWQPALAASVEYVGQDHGTRGLMVRVTHAPMPKNRVVIPLATPFKIADYSTLKEAEDAWREIVVATADHLGLRDAIDMTGVDLCRLFYLPRHAPGAPHDSALCGGDLFDWRNLVLDDPNELLAREGSKATGKSKTPEGQALKAWASAHADGFQIVDVLDAECHERIRNRVGVGVEIECPNDAGHSDAGNPDDRACLAINAGDGTAPVFTIKCQHDSCRDMTNLDMLGRMIADGWFAREVIEGDDYNALGEGDGATPTPSTGIAVAPATGSGVVVSDGYGGALAFTKNKGAFPKGVTYEKETRQVHPTYRNALLLIGHEKWDLGYNELTQNYGLRGEVEYPWPEHLGYALNDAIRREVRLYMLRRWGVTFKIQDVEEATMTLARRNAFNPVCDYLDDVEGRWDGEPRVDGWLEKYMGVKVTDENRAYVRAIGRIVLVAAVRRARKPGCKFDEVLILEGDQGSGKSTAVRILGGEWFSDANLGDLKNKAAPMKLRGVWIQEIAELTALNRAETSELKEFTSYQSDRYKIPYAKSEEDFPRRCIFIGTVNPGGGAYLADLTGNRRFWPVACGKVELEALERDRDQLWGEAAAMESDSESIRLDPSLYGAAKAEQAARLAEEPWVEILADYLDAQLARGKTRVLSKTLLADEDALHLPTDRQTQSAMKKLKAAMALIPSWAYKPTLRADGLRTAGYEYESTPPPAK